MKIEELKNRNFAEDMLGRTLSKIYKIGPVKSTDYEILSYISIFHPDLIEQHIDDINLYLGLFYKEIITPKSLQGCIQKMFLECIAEHFGKAYTPVQTSILNNSEEKRIFSFSAPTSTGKSHVLFSIIENSDRDVVVIVPSRALINEYYLRLCEEIHDKSINILTFVDKINTAKCRRSIFVLTPERCKDLFRLKDQFSIDVILFDEAQLTDEKGKRGLYFDAIVRRCNRELPDSKIIFAHPFVTNPEAQISKNLLPTEQSISKVYDQRNVGQIFVCEKPDGSFSYFGSDTNVFSVKQVACNYDPIESCIKDNGSVLFYVSKNSIITNAYLNAFSKYIMLCSEIEDPELIEIIEELSDFTGGGTVAYMNYYSQMLALLKRGIVIHHGSLPLRARMLVEKFTRKHFCRICFATSTLEQGINMPFDIVYIDRLESQKYLAVKNLIGRAGRSSKDRKIDYGTVIIASTKVAKLRKLLTQTITLNMQSQLDDNERLDDDYNDFKDAILHETFSDQFNLTQNQIIKLSDNALNEILRCILDKFFNHIDEKGNINLSKEDRKIVVNSFHQFYSNYLGRELQLGEKAILTTAFYIMIWRIQGRTFSTICHSRYAFLSRESERSKLDRLGQSTDQILARFTQKYAELPNNNLCSPISLFPRGLKAKDVDYDIITYDTYDYLDKLIGLYLSDIFYAAFIKYNERYPDDRAIKMANLIKYGTYNTKYIWMLRYGMSFEDIELLKDYIESIDERGIVVTQEFANLPQKVKGCIDRFV
ncbi:DEAD/DEAH box helicase [Bacteroides gallinaceum]|uniref:DEAD/DEAH box helicase n=1 Tax=Bacteroides gallinaceum TaxID=1462571 RepID=UPI00195E27F2|nr:DEAD/DEAH box helicase [Bacteroides gallinaceum]MBM6657508.1 DEAD/DEAH box helicase [Bacteroides gallinaceum]MDN0064928.1 DEAD/DEAH box helicase [Bacteroides gallinaceum]